MRQGIGDHRRQTERPYYIRYIKGDRQLSDTATTLEFAKERVAARLAKKHNKGERAEVWYRNKELVFSA
jgi:hypothetical protein